MKKKIYAQAGVDTDSGNKIKAQIPKLIRSTHRVEVLENSGGFAGLFSAKFSGYRDPILVSSMDGVGTKLKVAEMMKRHDTIGEDLVNHCVNDIACLGAEPLFFLDYIGTAKLEIKRFQEILSGLVRACKAAGATLIGGETAQMPGIYHGKDYDLVGTIIGVVERSKIIDGSKVKVGDVMIGLPSSGLHTNGYSLARKIFFEKCGLTPRKRLPHFEKNIGETLLEVHTSYLPLIRRLKKALPIKALSHITGGGLMDNLPRVLPKGVRASISMSSWEPSPLFKFLVEKGKIEKEEAYQTLNMGIGMVVIVSQKDARKALSLTRGTMLGKIEKGTRKVILKK